MRYAYKTCKSQTPFEKRARRVIACYWPLFFFWQGCLVLRLSVLHAPWTQFAGYGFLLVSLPAVLLFLFVQTKRTEAGQNKAVRL